MSLNFEMTIHYQKYICVEFKRIFKKQTFSQKRSLQSASCLLKVEVNLAFVCQKHLLNRIVKLHQLKKVRLKMFGISNLKVSKTIVVIGPKMKETGVKRFSFEALSSLFSPSSSFKESQTRKDRWCLYLQSDQTQ